MSKVNLHHAVVAARGALAAFPIRENAVFGGIILLAFLLRLYVILSTTYIFDEDHEWIPLGRSISFAHLPWRSASHSALTAYIVKATSAVIGENPLGYRVGFALAGTLAVWAVGKLAWECLGFRAAVVAASVMTFNEYHVAISAFATEKSPYLACGAMATLHFGRFLKLEKKRNLLLAAVFAGSAFIFKETAALLIPAFFSALLVSGRTNWLRRKETWLAAGLGLIVVLPDLIWNAVYWREGYGLHTGRISGLGLNPHYALFFARDLLSRVYQALGRGLFDPAHEYPSMNAVWGGILMASSVIAVLKWKKLEPAGKLAAILFWTVLLFFALGKPGESRLVEETGLMVDAKAWFWIDQILIGGSFLAAWCAASLTGRWRFVALGLVIAAGLLSTVRVLRNSLGIPDVRIVLSPSAVWPPDGRLVNVKAAMLACQICDARFRLVETKVNRYDEKGLVPSSGDEILNATLGTDDRDFQIRAATGPFPDRRVYRFQYAVSVGNSLPRTILPSVTVTKKQAPSPPFWAR
jgi:4-amino-4-deoxy-L-arabinose transferase-like glycosyltransferase